MSFMNDALTESIHRLRIEIAQREHDISRTMFPDLYKLGREQGIIEGLDLASKILEGKIEEFNT